MFMKYLRRVHTFLGCFFAPLLLFFVATGWYQTLNPDRKKGEGEADTLVGRLSTVHVDQHFPTASAQVYHTALFRYLVVVMCVALITTIAPRHRAGVSFKSSAVADLALAGAGNSGAGDSLVVGTAALR